MRVRCVVCRQVFKGHVPRGGDGSRLLPYRHKRKNPDEVFTHVWCDGHLVTGLPPEDE